MKIEELKNKKILLLGFGREGKDSFLFLRKLFPKKVLGIADKDEKVASSAVRRRGRVKWYLGENYLKALKNYDVIIKTPGIPFKILPKSVFSKITSQTKIFFDNCPGKIVGITGTKGKSTTASMVYQVLKAGGLKVHLIGNIGKPVLNLLPSPTKWDEGRDEAKLQRPFSATPKDIYVYELSSHQLYNLKKSPNIAVFLNIFREHLDYYQNFKEYVSAKANITRYQTKVEENKSSSLPFAATRVDDYLVYNSQDKIVKEIAKKSRAKKIPIKGKYYELDKAAARVVGKIFKIPSKIIEKALKEFKYLPHRLELVGTFKRITFYNDALATIPEATIAAMDKLGGKVETIMLGGFERNIDFKNLAKKVLKSKIKTVILFPTTGEKIWNTITKFKRRGVSAELPKHFFVDNMRDAVKLAYQNTRKGKICLLSTASSSFSIFKDYKEKGNLFKKQVFAQARR